MKNRILNLLKKIVEINMSMQIFAELEKLIVHTVFWVTNFMV